MTTAGMRGNRQEVENEEYRQRMLVNTIAATFVTFLMVVGYWVVTRLSGVV
jgi:hypothetical protein